MINDLFTERESDSGAFKFTGAMKTLEDHENFFCKLLVEANAVIAYNDLTILP